MQYVNPSQIDQMTEVNLNKVTFPHWTYVISAQTQIFFLLVPSSTVSVSALFSLHNSSSLVQQNTWNFKSGTQNPPDLEQSAVTKETVPSHQSPAQDMNELRPILCRL